VTVAALRAVVAGALLVVAGPLAAQTDGAIAGRVREAGSGRPLPGARVEVVGRGRPVEADSVGAYRVPEVRAGVYTVEVRAIGYRMARLRGVRVLAGEVSTVDADLEPATVLMDSVIVATTPDPVLDPLSTATAQHITAEEIRRLPVTTVAEAVAISAELGRAHV
jgi:hypothetical protein